MLNYCVVLNQLSMAEYKDMGMMDHLRITTMYGSRPESTEERPLRI